MAKVSFVGAMVAIVVLTATTAAEKAVAQSHLPGSSDDVTLTPSTVVLGVDSSLLVSGRGFEDCVGSVNLRLLIDDDWSASRPGTLLGTAAGSIDDSGNLEGVIDLSAAWFPGAWTGYVVMDGACIPEGLRRVFGPVSLAVPIDSAEVITSGRITPPSGAGGAAGFLIPAAFLDRAFVEPGGNGGEPRAAVGTLRAFVDGFECAAASAGEAGSDLVVYIGLPGQPSACSPGDASVVLALGRGEAFPLTNKLTTRPGVIQSVRPVFLPPTTGETVGIEVQPKGETGGDAAGDNNEVVAARGFGRFAWMLSSAAVLVLLGAALGFGRRTRRKSPF